MFEQPADFLAESDALHDLLERLPDADFDRPTRFKQWTINHVLAHLHLGNWAALETVINEPGYLAFRAERKATVPPMPMREFEKRWAGGLQGRALLAAWRELYPQVARTFQTTDPKRRLKWAGPDMSARSSISARLMETWAHGQAVYDLLGVERQDGDRIRNIVVLGINTFGWTFTVHEQPVPERMPQVRLTAPSGASWTFGDASELDCIEGRATEFCQVVTQVRNVADTSLRVAGPVATQWMRIAQAFAGLRRCCPHQGPGSANQWRTEHGRPLRRGGPGAREHNRSALSRILEFSARRVGHVDHGPLDLRVAQRRIAALGRHLADALDGGPGQRLLPFLDQRRPGFDVAELGRAKHPGRMAGGADRGVDRLT